MTKEDIIRMAKEAGFVDYELDDGTDEAFDIRYVRFAKLVAEHERDRLHDKFMAMHEAQKHSNNYWHFAARQIKENT